MLCHTLSSSYEFFYGAQYCVREERQFREMTWFLQAGGAQARDLFKQAFELQKLRY